MSDTSETLTIVTACGMAAPILRVLLTLTGYLGYSAAPHLDPMTATSVRLLTEPVESRCGAVAVGLSIAVAALSVSGAL